MEQLFPELLAEIFMNIISIPGIDESLHSRQTHVTAPYLLSSVFQFWRAVAISTPALWSVQPAIGFQDLRYRTEGFIVFVDGHIRRSRDAPIHVALRGGLYYHDHLLHDNPNRLDPEHPALMTIIQQSRRWESLVVEDLVFTLLYQLLRSITRFPILACLNLHDIHMTMHSQNGLNTLSIFRHSLLLRHVNLPFGFRFQKSHGRRL